MVFGFARDASEPVSVRVPGSDSPALAVYFESMPGSHDGTSAFTLRLGFSEAVDITATALRDVLAVSGGTVSQVAQVDGRSDLWEVTVMPNSAGDVEIRLSPSLLCGAGSVCTEAGVPLSVIYAVLIPGPATANQETEPAGEATGPSPWAAGRRRRGRRGHAELERSRDLRERVPDPAPPAGSGRTRAAGIRGIHREQRHQLQRHRGGAWGVVCLPGAGDRCLRLRGRRVRAGVGAGAGV